MRNISNNAIVSFCLSLKVEKHVLCVIHMLRQNYGRTNKIHTLVHSFLRCSISEGSGGTFITILLQPTTTTTTTTTTNTTTVKL